MTVLEAAIMYARSGWHVFPCRPKLKVPLTNHGVKDATTNEETIQSWWARWPDANIALACGPKSGVYVVDVDVDETKNINGWESLKEFPSLPMTVEQRSPRGGGHYLFKTDDPPRNKNSFRPGIDIRSTGYYIMLPPSIHPNGKEYAWVPDQGPTEIELAEFPGDLRPETEKPRPAPWENTKNQKPKSKSATKTNSPNNQVIERAKLYLDECDPAIKGSAGHDSLFWACRAMVDGFELSREDALSLLWTYYNPRCNPPWDRNKPSDVKDFERKVDEVFRTPGSKPRGWLLDDNDLRGDTGVGRAIAESLLDGKGKPREKSVEKPAIISGVKPSLESPSWPDWLLEPPGMVGQLCAWINETAGCYQPRLALGASLAACGVLMGRKVADESDGRTNMYVMGVAHSSAGKDHPADCVEKLFAASGASTLLGGSRVTSDSALELALEVNPSQLFTWDEVGHMFAAIKQAGVGSGNAMHLRTIVPALMQLYSSPHKLYIGKQKAEGEARRIDQPHVCIWGLTSPDVLLSSLSRSELRDGWLGRVITIFSSDRPMYRITQRQPPPEHLINLVQAWLVRSIPAPEGTGDISGAIGAYQIETPMQAQARKVFDDFNKYTYKKREAYNKKGDDAEFLWGKALQNARRIALVLANGDRYEGAEITEYHAHYGCEFISATIKDFELAIEHSMADSQWEADKQKILRLITQSGKDGISKAALTKRTQFIKDRKTRNAYLEDLQEAGMIDFGFHPDHPNARSGWYWKHPYGTKYSS